MATGGEEKVGYSLVRDQTVPLRNVDESNYYNSIIVCEGTIVSIDDKWTVRLHQLDDGKLLATYDGPKIPCVMCLIDTMEICVLYEDGLIKALRVDVTSMSHVFTMTKSFYVKAALDEYHGVVRFKNGLVVTGIKQGTMYWCIISLANGHTDRLHQICDGYIKIEGLGWRLSYVTTKDDLIYFSCWAGSDADNTGVYGFDILNPTQCKYTHKHECLQSPRGIVTSEDGNIYVCNGYIERFIDFCIHQLTASCELVAIFALEIPCAVNYIYWDHGHLYATGFWSREITVFHPVYQVDHKASDVLLIDERKPFIEETSTLIVERIPFEKRVEEYLNQAGIQMSTEELDSFQKFQCAIGTTLYFSKDQQTLIDCQESLKATEMFLQKNHPDMMEKWLVYKNQGKLTPELIDVIYAKERDPELHDKKDDVLKQMEQLNIIVKARAFSENGVKEENCYFTPCMLHEKCPEEIISPGQEPHMLSTSILCWVSTGTFLPPSIFQRLIAACLARWPVAKKRTTAENLIFYDCAVFDLDLLHRLTLHCKDHVVFARITRMVIDDVETLNAKLCTRVRKFITLNLSEITSSLNQNLKYKLCVQNQDSQDVHEGSGPCFSPPFEMWLADEVYDPDSNITREHINYARLCIALVTVCGKAMREIFLTNFPIPYRDIYQALLANQKSIHLNKDQRQLVFPDAKGRYTGTVDQFDLSLLYTLTRSVSRVPAPQITGWGMYPQDQPRDSSLGASLERIRTYRNHISGHSPDGIISQQDFEDYWNKFEAVIHDIETMTSIQDCSPELEKQKRQVISIYEAC